MFCGKAGQKDQRVAGKKVLTQDRAAELAGITGKYWGEVERGCAAVSLVVLDGMSKALGASVADVMETEHLCTRQEVLEKLETCLRQSDDHTLRLYLRLLRTLQM